MKTVIQFLASYKPLGNILVAMAIVLIGRWLSKVVARVLERIMTQARIEPTVARFIMHLSSIAVLVIATLIALEHAGIETTSLLAILGAAGLAIGLALRGSLSNLAAGVLLVVFRPFKQGDLIEVSGTMGTVQEIQLFNTILNTPENLRKIIPNANITSAVITNYTVNETRRVDFVLEVRYDEELKKVKQVLANLLAEHPFVLKEPAPFVAVSDLGESSVKLVVWVWVRGADFRAVRFGLLEEVTAAFAQHGMTHMHGQKT